MRPVCSLFVWSVVAAGWTLARGPSNPEVGASTKDDIRVKTEGLQGVLEERGWSLGPRGGSTARSGRSAPAYFPLVPLKSLKKNNLGGKSLHRIRSQPSAATNLLGDRVAKRKYNPSYFIKKPGPETFLAKFATFNVKNADRRRPVLNAGKDRMEQNVSFRIMDSGPDAKYLSKSEEKKIPDTGISTRIDAASDVRKFGEKVKYERGKKGLILDRGNYSGDGKLPENDSVRKHKKLKDPAYLKKLLLSIEQDDGIPETDFSGNFRERDRSSNNVSVAADSEDLGSTNSYEFLEKNETASSTIPDGQVSDNVANRQIDDKVISNSEINNNADDPIFPVDEPVDAEDWDYYDESWNQQAPGGVKDSSGNGSGDSKNPRVTNMSVVARQLTLDNNQQQQQQQQQVQNDMPNFNQVWRGQQLQRRRQHQQQQQQQLRLQLPYILGVQGGQGGAQKQAWYAMIAKDGKRQGQTVGNQRKPVGGGSFLVMGGQRPPPGSAGGPQNYRKQQQLALRADNKLKNRRPGVRSATYCKLYEKFSWENVTSESGEEGSPEKTITRRQSCPPSFTPLIVGGIDVLEGEFPHMAAIGFNRSDEIDYLCGGSLVSPHFVITAAHCAITRWGPPVVVYLGSSELYSGKGSVVKVLEVHTHERYSPPSSYNDIALLRIDRRQYRMSPRLRPACLPAPDTDRHRPGRVTVATGWGKLGFGRESSYNLKKVTLEVMDNRKCEEYYASDVKTSSLSKGITANLICAAGHIDKFHDTCQGDSGGPLQWLNSDRCMYELVGITSFGKSCGVGVPGVYTRLAPYLAWIEHIVWPLHN